MKNKEYIARKYNIDPHKTEEMAANILKQAKELSKPMMEAQKEYARAHQSVPDTPLAKQTAELLPEGLFTGAGTIGGESTADFMKDFMGSHNSVMSSAGISSTSEANNNNSLVQDVVAGFMESNANVMQNLGMSGTNSSSQNTNDFTQFALDMQSQSMQMMGMFTEDEGQKDDDLD